MTASGASHGPGRRRCPVRLVSPLLLGATLAGCAATPLYLPERQPSGLTISAGISLRDGRLLVKVDSEGYRVEWAELVRDGATAVVPEALVPPTEVPSSGLSIGIGVGGGSSRGSYAGGTGLGVGGPYRESTTLAVFHLDEAGPPPWRLRVKVVGIEPVDIVVDPSRSARQ